MTIQKLVEAIIKSIQENPDEWVRKRDTLWASEIGILLDGSIENISIMRTTGDGIPANRISKALKRKLSKACPKFKEDIEDLSKLIP